MIRDPKIFITSRLRRFHHLVKRVNAVRLLRVRVQNAATVPIPNEAVQRTPRSERHLISALPQFGRDVVKVESPVDAAFVSGGNARAPAP